MRHKIELAFNHSRSTLEQIADLLARCDNLEKLGINKVIIDKRFYYLADIRKTLVPKEQLASFIKCERCAKVATKDAPANDFNYLRVCADCYDVIRSVTSTGDMT